MLATQKKQPSVWPTLKPTNQCSSLAVKLINVTGSKIKTSTTVRPPSDDERDAEGYEHVPSFNQSLGDAIAQALEQAEKEEEHEEGKNH